MGVEREEARRLADSLELASALSGKTLLVTGASGFLGGSLVQTAIACNDLLEGGEPVRVVAVVRDEERARMRLGEAGHDRAIEFIVQDVNRPLPESVRFDYAVHAASPATPRAFGADPVGTMLPNLLGTKNVMEAAERTRASSVLFLSTSEIYGRLPAESIPTRETDLGIVDPTDLRSCYAESKRAGETLCVAWHERGGVPVKIARPFHIYGPGMSLGDGRIFSDLVANVVQGGPLVLRSDGSAVRSYCYVRDATAAFFTILLHGTSPNAYNVGDPASEVSVLELAQLLVDMFPERKLTIQHETRAADDTYIPSPTSRSSPHVARLQELGWHPTIGLAEGFSLTVESFEEHT